MESCLSEDRGAPLSFETSSIQSYFKQLSWSRQGVHKRSRPLRSSFYGYPDIEEQVPPLLRAHSGLDGNIISNYFLTEVRNEALSTPGDVPKSSGLVRSQSYPLEGFYNGTEKLHISKASSGLAESGYDTHLWSLKDALTAPQNSDVDTISFQPVTVEVVQHQNDTKIGNLCEITATSGDVVQPTSEAPSIIDITMEALVEIPSSSIEGPVHSPQSTAVPVVESEGTAFMDVLQGEGMRPEESVVPSQQNHCLSARECPPGSKVLACGRRREMEDTASVVPSFAALPCGVMGMCCSSEIAPAKQTVSDLHFFGIYDGHGGSQASIYCKQRLHLLLAEELNMLASAENRRDHIDQGGSCSWKKTMTDCFLKIDKEVGGVCPNGICDDEAIESSCACCEDAIAPENVGTTAVVAVVGSCQIVIANCGDSRAVLSRGGMAMALSTDHKPEREDETMRIEAAGGRVICWDGYRVGGFLALSRAIGDRYLKRYVISEPEVTCIQRENDDEVLILASDGLWDVISNDYACEVARKALLAVRKKRENRTFSPGEDPASASVAALLVKLAYSRGSKDNISVVVVDLKC